MKRLYFILGLILSLLLFSCEKEQDPIPPKDCKCGTLTNYGANYSEGQIRVIYWIELKNNCTQNYVRLSYSGYVGMNPPKEWQEAKDSGKWCGYAAW